MRKLCYLFLLLGLTCATASAQTIISEKNGAGFFPVVASTGTTTIVFDAKEDSLIHVATQLFSKDVEMVSGKKPAVASALPSAKNIILIGSIRSIHIQQLVKTKKLNIDKLKNRWEAYQIQVIQSPFKGIDQALVIAGSDRRGTAYGVFELSQQMGVSPWYWWADVPVKKKKEVYLRRNAAITDAPYVKYRGIFINDEAPALSNWSRMTFGGFNHNFYSQVFELMLRLKANYLWPAMWGSSFYDDDPLNKQAADKYGIVIGTSHHEPLMRAHDEWRRYGQGKWNYDSNEIVLKDFWKKGIQRATNEKIVTIGMRGDGDEPMSEETATALLERIVKDQRKIIEDVTGKPANQTPQIWALYKEVQDYYDKGMRVPDDVTLLIADDNWGNIRRLPKLNEPKRKGGYGIYYHFDYVGGPRNYKWLNTNNIARVWEQMHMAYRYGADRIWIVNVGDIKPMELPTSFFLEYAWNPAKWNEDNIHNFYSNWAEKQFDSVHAKSIGNVLRRYAQLSARRKPELLDEKTYSIKNYGEAEVVLEEWKQLENKADSLNEILDAQAKDAFFQLVLHPIKALSNLHHMYYAVAKNREYAPLKYKAANEYADRAKELYLNDSLITLQYHTFNNGKWRHMMSQTHIGYTYWQQPEVNKMPEVYYVPANEAQPTPGISFEDVAIALVPDKAKGNVFYEEEGFVSMEASHWTRANNTKNVRWKAIPDIGRTGSGITTFPVTTKVELSASSPHVEYEFYNITTGKASLHLYFSPTLNFHNNPEGLLFAVSIDDEKPQIISLNKDDNQLKTWEEWVANNINIKTSVHHISKHGKHVVKYWSISPGIVLQKLVVDFGGMKHSYLGPPETKAQ